MSNHTNRLIVPQARHVSSVEDLEDTSFIFDRSVGSLIENAPHVTIAFRGLVSTAYACALIVAGAGADPRR